MSVACAPRARMAVNASWPGVSRKVIFWPRIRHGVRADVLGDAARLARGDAGLADVVQQRGLAVVDVAHDGDDRRTGEEILLGILNVLVLEGVLGGLGQLHFQFHAEFGADQLRGVEVQFVVDGGDDAQHHQLFDDLAGRLADALRRGRAQ